MKDLSEFRYPCFIKSHVLYVGELYCVATSDSTGFTVEGGKAPLVNITVNTPDPDVAFYFDNKDFNIFNILISNTEYNFDIKINQSTPHRYIDLMGMGLTSMLAIPAPPAVPPVRFNELSREQHLDLINHVLDGGVLEELTTTNNWINLDYLPDSEDGIYRKRELTEIEKIDRQIRELELRKQELKNA